MNLIKIKFILGLFCFAHINVDVASASTRNSEHCQRALIGLSDWINKELVIAKHRLLRNIYAYDTKPGSVIASPSHKDPDYFYHWVRDAALTMDVVVQLYHKETDTSVKGMYEKSILDYLFFSRQNQQTYTLTNLGEPKFYPDGRAFFEHWGRPQNDSPALRAITAINIAHLWIQQDKKEWVRNILYKKELPAETLIKADIEFVSHHWLDPSFDLWEESKGDHFYTALVQRKALREAALLASIMDDEKAAEWYQIQASRLEERLQRFWNEKAALIETTQNRVGGIESKSSNLDVAVILGVLHTNDPDFFAANHEQVLATAEHLRKSFASIYGVNTPKAHELSDIPVAGRYPEDVYMGGHPWYLTTAAFAEHDYKVVSALKKKKQVVLSKANVSFYESVLSFNKNNLSISAGETLAETDPRFAKIIEALILRADSTMARIRQFTPDSGEMAEQFHRDHGHPVSAKDLTWSYASFITASMARNEALQEK